MSKAGALEGIRVLDFGQYVAGPLTAMFLSDHGADVVRIDPPGGPRYATPANATWNRGKRSIVLDLKNPGDKDIALSLTDTADVLIENFRPNVMQRLGLGVEAVTTRNPSLIYCSMPGFSASDPRAEVRAWEGILGAATACYAPDPDPAVRSGRPIFTAIPHSSCFGAFLSATSIAMALHARNRDGRGQSIEVPLFNATFNAISNRAIKVWNGPKFRTLPKGRHALCKDGRWIMYVPGDKNFPRFLDSVNQPDLKALLHSPVELSSLLESLFQSRNSADWEREMLGLEIECMTCHSSAEWLHHPQAIATGIIDEFEDPVLGRFRGPGISVRLSDSPGRVRFARRLPDADRKEILSELATLRQRSVPDSVEDLRGALAGVKVLDLCLFIAGPTCGRTLAEFGADVIKIDSPHRAQVNWHADVNRGKRTLLLDLKHPEGMEIFWRLLDEADVVLQNMRKGAAEKIGIGYEQVLARRPDIVYCSINAFGQTGPYAGFPGVEVLAQAMTGIQDRFGGVRPAIAPFNACDFGTGLMSAYGIALALLHRTRTGKGQHVDNALLYTATMLQSPFLQDFAGKQWNDVRGQQALGRGPLYRAYQALDGWLFICTNRTELINCPDFAHLIDTDLSALAAEMERIISRFSVSEWLKKLRRAGIAGHEVVNEVADLMTDPVVRAHGLSICRFHEDHGAVTTIGPSAKLSRTPVITGRASPRPGTDAASVLAEIGLAGEMDRLIRDRVLVVEGITGSTPV